VKNLKFGWKYRKEPTPKIIGGVGDIIFWSSMVVSGITLFQNYLILPVILFVIGISLKIISICFTTKK
jgi:hypothetical protein